MLRPSLALAVALGLSALAGCKAEPKVEAAAPGELAGVAPVQAAPAPVVAQMPAPSVPPPVQGVSYATFDKSRLDECNDSRIDPTAGNEAAAAESLKLTTTKVEALIKGWKGTDKPLILGKRCPEQFSDRTVFATCESDRAAKLGRTTVKTYYYNLQTLEASDLAMKSCLESKGTWSANSDRRIVDAERRRNTRRKLETMLAEAESAAQ